MTRIGVVVFVAGAATLATEIAASRLLAPYFGSSTVVWANVIGLVLVYLSVGYWLGGKLADRRPQARLLGAGILAAAAWIAVLPFVAKPILDLVVDGLDAVSAGAAVGSFVAALALFSVPVVLLGAVTPFAIRLTLDDLGRAGTVTGRLYAISTVGAILGTFGAAVASIPLVGTQRTMLACSVALAAAAALLLGTRWLAVTAALAALLAIPPGIVKASDGLLVETESAYQYVQVLERDDGSRVLKVNEGIGAHSLWRPGSSTTGGYWDMFLVVPPLLGRPVERMLVIGNAGGTIARAYAEFYPAARIDGVELDEAVTDAGRRFLGLDDNPRLRVVAADGRPYLRATERRYDVIVVDAFRGQYVPFYLTTTEFFELARSRLTPGGIVAMNVGGLPGDDDLTRALESTVAASFPQAWGWTPLRYNELVLGLDRATPHAELARRAERVPGRAAVLGRLFAASVQPLAIRERPLTDDRAPVEWLTDRLIVESLSDRELDEEYLPTRP